MRVRVMLLVVVVLGATACSGAVTGSSVTTAVTAADPTTPAPDPEPAPITEAAPGTQQEAADPGVPEATESERVRPDGPGAPDFVLALGEGGEFSLSAEVRPVYMVFWAEW